MFALDKFWKPTNQAKSYPWRHLKTFNIYYDKYAISNIK